MAAATIFTLGAAGVGIAGAKGAAAAGGLKGGLANLANVGGLIKAKAVNMVTFGKAKASANAFVASGGNATVASAAGASTVASNVAAPLALLGSIGGGKDSVRYQNAPLPTPDVPVDPPTTPTPPTPDPTPDPSASAPKKGRLGQTLGKLGKITSHPLVAAGIMGVGNSLSQHAARQADEEFWRQRVQWMRDSNEGLASVMRDPTPYPHNTDEQFKAIDRKTADAVASVRPTAPASPSTSSILGEAARKFVSGRALLPHAANS